MKSKLAIPLALAALSVAGFSAAGMLPSFHIPERDKDFRSEEESQRRLAEAQAKRDRRAAKARAQS